MTEAQKRAQYRYYYRHREEILERKRTRHHERYLKDEDYRNKCRQDALLRYHNDAEYREKTKERSRNSWAKSKSESKCRETSRSVSKPCNITERNCQMTDTKKDTPQNAWNKRNRDRINAREKERYYTDPDYREHIKDTKLKQYHNLSAEAKAERNAKASAKQKDRYRNDPVWREERKRQALESYYRRKAEKENSDV